MPDVDTSYGSFSGSSFSFQFLMFDTLYLHQTFINFVRNLMKIFSMYHPTVYVIAWYESV